MQLLINYDCDNSWEWNLPVAMRTQSSAVEPDPMWVFCTPELSPTPNQMKQSRLFSSKAHHRSYHSNHCFITSYPIKWLTVCFIAALYFFKWETVVAPITWNWPPITTGLFYLRENLLNKNICLKEKRMCHWVSALLRFTSQQRL